MKRTSRFCEIIRSRLDDRKHRLFRRKGDNAAAESFADKVPVPRDIIRDVESGVEGNGNYIVIPDRAGAITYALLVAKQNDVVVISGKGAENYTEVRGERVRYSDRAEVLESFRRYNL